MLKSIPEVKKVIKPIVTASSVWQIYHTRKCAERYMKYYKTKPIKVICDFGEKKQFHKMVSYIASNGDCCENDFFYYYVDPYCFLAHKYRVIDNIAINYSKIVNSGLYGLLSQDTENPIALQNNCVLKDVIEFNVTMQNRWQQIDTPYAKRHCQNFQKMLEYSADSLEDACQRILLWNQFMWQSQHTLMGLGRLDKTLCDAYEKGKQKGEDAYLVIKNFLHTLHQYYHYKSSALLGDTGQLIFLGGLEPDGTYYQNELTMIFLQVARELHLPDPKFIVRVSQSMPREVLIEAVKNIASGIGNPLLSNDDVIIPSLETFYDNRDDAYDYVSTACWAPVAYGNDISQANLIHIEFARILLDLIKSEAAEQAENFQDFLASYERRLKDSVLDKIQDIRRLRWEKDPLLTFFVAGCVESMKDISSGGAKYNDYGIQSIGLANAVNSLYYLKKYVYEEKRMTLIQVRDVLTTNYAADLKIWYSLKNEKIGFGSDNPEILELTNNIIDVITETLRVQKNVFNHNFKFGLSSPSFITFGKETGATFDGRKAGEPLGVQITSDKQVTYTELVRFASKLHYSDTCMNGNVVDMIINQHMMENHFDKLVDFIMGSIKLGICQMQFNVLSYASLVDAKAHPEKYPQLIVRVWGFNAYFNDLPEEYKDLLIERAKRAEKGFA